MTTSISTVRAPGFIRGNPQLTRNGKLKHLLSIEALPRAVVEHILDTATQYVGEPEREIAKVPVLEGISVRGLFFESSVRTRSNFETAAQGLSTALHHPNIGASSAWLSPSLLGTLNTPATTRAELVVMRHGQSGAPYLIAQHCAPHVHVINAGDGHHAHPVQGLLDLYTIRHYKPNLRGLTVAIVGDMLHSRAARSDIHALSTLGVPEIRVIGPRTLVPNGIEQLGVRVFHEIEAGLRGVDVIIMLRLRNELLSSPWLPSAQEYFKHYGLTAKRLALAAPDAIVIHPGPINRGVEIESSVVDAVLPVILKQNSFGVAVCMAVMDILVSA